MIKRIFEIVSYIAILTLAVAPWLVTFHLLLSHFNLPASLDKAGQMGDSFGIVNALFSSLAFAGILITIIHQGRQAHKDRQITSRQMFESTFFEINKIARETKDSVTFIRETCFRGKDAANKLRDIFSEVMRESNPDWNSKENPRQFTEMELTHFFRLAMQRVPMFAEFIAFFAVIQAELEFLENRPPFGSKQEDAAYQARLLEVVRTTFDSSTLALMLLYGLGDQKTSDMIIKYDLARHMNRGEVWRLCKSHYALKDGKLPKRQTSWGPSTFEPD